MLNSICYLLRFRDHDLKFTCEKGKNKVRLNFSSKFHYFTRHTLKATSLTIVIWTKTINLVYAGYLCKDLLKTSIGFPTEVDNNTYRKILIISPGLISILTFVQKAILLGIFPGTGVEVC